MAKKKAAPKGKGMSGDKHMMPGMPMMGGKMPMKGMKGAARKGEK